MDPPEFSVVSPAWRQGPVLGCRGMRSVSRSRDWRTWATDDGRASRTSNGDVVGSAGSRVQRLEGQAMHSTADLRWPFTVRPLTPKLGAEISGVEIARGITPEVFRAIYDAFLRYQVLLFPPQDVPPAAQVAFARQFGQVQVHVMAMYHADGFPELYRLSNLDANGTPNGKHPDKGTLAWHTDGSWQRITGQATIIYGEIVPETGGETHFCDMYGAYERLTPEWKARIANRRAVHNLDFSRTRRHGEDLMTEAQKREK